MSVNLKFKYGTQELNAAKNAGNIYVRKIASATNENKDNGRAKLYIDTPISNGEVERLSVGSDVFVGDPNSEEASNYDVIINPAGNIINNVVTSEQSGGFVIRVVEQDNPDTWVPDDQPNENTITLVVQRNGV